MFISVSYTHLGLLMDIGDLVEKADQKEKFFDNIVNAYKKDGALRAVPTGFSIPVLVGEQSVLDLSLIHILAKNR